MSKDFATAAGSLRDRWFPIARIEEVAPRHVLQAKLLDQELAVWRDDAGRPNAWENRCPHRGVRLSIGINDGAHLRCRYHGWRYGSGSGRCTCIPAHPALVPAAAIAARAYSVVERYGYVWVALGHPPGPPHVDALDGDPVITLQSRFVEAPPASVGEALARHYAFAPSVDAPTIVRAAVTRIDDFELEAKAGGDLVVLLLQPVSADQTIMHAALIPDRTIDELELRRHHQERLALVRDAAEAGAPA